LTALPHVRVLDIDGSLPRSLISQIAEAATSLETVRLHSDPGGLFWRSPFRTKTLVVRPEALRADALQDRRRESNFGTDDAPQLADKLVVHVDGIRAFPILHGLTYFPPYKELVIIFDYPLGDGHAQLSIMQVISSVFPLLLISSPVIAVGTESGACGRFSLRDMIISRLERSPYNYAEDKVRFMTKDEYRLLAGDEVWMPVSHHNIWRHGDDPALPHCHEV